MIRPHQCHNPIHRLVSCLQTGQIHVSGDAQTPSTLPVSANLATLDPLHPTTIGVPCLNGDPQDPSRLQWVRKVVADSVVKYLMDYQ